MSPGREATGMMRSGRACTLSEFSNTSEKAATFMTTSASGGQAIVRSAVSSFPNGMISMIFRMMHQLAGSTAAGNFVLYL
jgi:hypothetical protein